MAKISQNFRGVPGNPSVSENEPSLYIIANKNCPNFGTKQVSGRGRDEAKYEAFLALIRVKNRVSSGSGGMSAISHNRREIAGNPSVSENAHFGS